MEFTILKSSSEKAKSKGNGNGSNHGSQIHYNSKSLERPKRAKGNHEASSSGTAAVVQSLSGRSTGSGLNEVDNDTDSVGTCDSDEGMLDQAYRKPRAMSTDPYYSRTAIKMRLRSSTATGAKVAVARPHTHIAMDDFSLNRNSPFAESYRFAVENNALARTGSADNPTRRTQQCKAAVDEILNTERTYVLRLNDVLKGYRDPLNVRMHELPISVEDAKVLFAEIREIRDFNRGLLEAVEGCGYDMKKVGECFLQTWSREEGCQLYSQYCTKYPLAVEVYAKCVENATMLEFFKKCQHDIRHALPLGSDLLEPVQRVLRYHILLQKILSNLHEGEDGYAEIKAAHETMTGVAEQINEMKRKHESAVHVHEVQSQLQGWGGNDLTSYGELTLEDTFKYYSGRGSNIPFRGTEDRHVFLFKRLILLTKKREEMYKYKGHIEWTDLQLIETLERHPNSFQVKQLSTGTIHTFHPRSDAVKQLWIKSIKKMIVESIPEISHRISPNLKDLLLKGARKADLTPENISGDFRHKSTSMQGLNEISRESSPRLSGSRLTSSVTANSPRTMDMLNQGPVSADDSRLPNRRSSSTERLHFPKEYDSGAQAADSGIALETVRGTARSHPSMTHSKSAGLNERSGGQHHSQMSHNVSDSQVLEKSKSPTDKDSLYSSDSIGSLDQAEMSDLDQGRTRGSSPSTDVPMSDSPAHDGLSSGTRTRSSGRRKKARPTSFAESDNIPEDDTLPRELSPSSQTFRKSESPSAEPPATLEHLDGAVSQSSLFPESLFASLESQWGDSLLTQLMQKSDTTSQSNSEATRLLSHNGQSTTTAMQSTMPATGPPAGIITRGHGTVEPRAKLSRRQSNELGSELQEDRYCQLKGSFARRQTLDEDLETTYFDDEHFSLPPPAEGLTEDPLHTQEVSQSRFPILTPPDTFRSTSHTDLESTVMSPAPSENFFTPAASPDPNTATKTPSDVLPCEVAVLHPGTTADNGDVTSAQPSTSTAGVSVTAAAVPESSDSLAVSDQGASTAVSPSPTNSAESELAPSKRMSLTQSTPVSRRLIAVEMSDKRRPLSLCSVDSQSSDGSPSGLRRRILVSMVKSDSANILQSADACLDLRSAMLSRSGDESKSPTAPTVSVQDTDTSSDAESRKDSIYSLQSAEINFDAETPVNTDRQEMTIDEILPILDEAAGKIMEEATSRPSSNSSSSVPSILIEVCGDVKKQSKMGSARMSPLRRHTTPDMAAALEAESDVKSKEKSPSTKVKKIARDYSRRIREGKAKFTRFQSFTSPSGYTALDSPDVPRKSMLKSELSSIHHTFNNSEPGSAPKPPRPPWLEEAKRVRELRKFQTSPSDSSLDSAGSLSVATPTESVASDCVVSETTVNQSKLSLDSAPAHVSAMPLHHDKQTDRQIRPQLSASPSDLAAGDLLVMRELSKSTDAIPRSLSTSDVKSTKSLRKANRSPSFNRASIASDMVISHEDSRPRLGESSFEDIRHRGRLRGFVRSLVDRFSGRNN